MSKFIKVLIVDNDTQSQEGLINISEISTVVNYREYVEIITRSIPYERCYKVITPYDVIVAALS